MFDPSDISGPIILETYRVISDFTKTSKHELDLHTDDQVEIVEKNQNGGTSSTQTGSSLKSPET